MTYLAGMSPGAAVMFGTDPRDPHVRCDGCGATQAATRADGLPFRWLLKNRAPPGWRMDRPDDDATKRRDYCPACRELS